MDFSHEQRFNAQKASRIGAVALAHIILGGALIYRLHTTCSLRVDGPLPFTPEPPLIQQPVEPRPLPGPIVGPVTIHDALVEPPPTIPGPENPISDNPPKPGPVIYDAGGPGTGLGEPGLKPVQVHVSSPAFSNLDSCKPVYPAAALKSEEEGTTRLKLEVGANGQLVGASVVKSSGFADLDRAAVRGLSQCAFKAATQDGTPVQSSLVTDYVWSMQQ